MVLNRVLQVPGLGEAEGNALGLGWVVGFLEQQERLVLVGMTGD